MYQVSSKVFFWKWSRWEEIGKSFLGGGRKVAPARPASWKDVDHNVMSHNFIYIAVSRWQGERKKKGLGRESSKERIPKSMMGQQRNVFSIRFLFWCCFRLVWYLPGMVRTTINKDITSFNKLFKKTRKEPKNPGHPLSNTTLESQYYMVYPKSTNKTPPLRPIISSIGSATYIIARVTTKILTPPSRHNQPLTRHRIVCILEVIFQTSFINGNRQVRSIVQILNWY